ncbi:MAG: putative S-adenosyl-L-methionine-dependent methyltransferase [Rhizobium sp.]|nr:putative S-adenosyl-L-methionine-dependent methyltransferase [Rhizobium sp.]
MQDILNAYAVAATPSFIGVYEALSVEAIYEHVIDLFPCRAASVLDIGAGTGRDAAWFAARGHTVLAVEPVRELREAGRQLHHSSRIEWVDDRLPNLTITSSNNPFDLVLLGGVWQHLAEAEQKAAIPTLATLTAAGGRLVMSLRHGPAAGARRVFPIDPATTAENAELCGLRLIRSREANSIQQGNQKMGIHWTWLVFEKVR